MKVISRIAVVLVAVGVVASLVTPAYAICVNASQFNGAYSALTSPAGTPDIGRVKGNFWSLGNTAISNGSWPADQWVRIYLGSQYYIAGDWAQDPGIAGCPHDAPAPQPAHMVYTLQDDNGVDSFYTVQCIQEDPQQNFVFTPNGALNPMVPFPKPRITASSRTGTTTNLTVTHQPLDAAGALSDGTCGSLITGFRVYSKTVPRGGPAPTTRARASWDPQGGTQPLGGSVPAATTCAVDSDVYLATSLIFADGVESQIVSADATKVECGPNIATPEGGDDFRFIRKPKNAKGR